MELLGPLRTWTLAFALTRTRTFEPILTDRELTCFFPSLGNLGTTLIEIYAIMGKHTEVTKFKSTIENETKFPVAKAHFHSSIFKALGNKRQPEEATDLLIEALQATRNVKADLGLLSFNTLIKYVRRVTQKNKQNRCIFPTTRRNSTLKFFAFKFLGQFISSR